MSYITYDKNGYISIPDILKCGQPFIFVTGGRGTGKTYGALKYVLESGRRFMWMRRTQGETDMINKPEFQPFKVLNEDLERNIQPHPISKGSAAFIDEDADGDPLGYTCALSTIANMRGFDASDVELLIYDEFIPERHKSSMKAEGDALLNAYETLNRNRELQGRPPMQLLALSNSNNLDNAIFNDLGLVDIAEQMETLEKDEWIDEERGLAIFFLNRSPVSSKKGRTALYKFAAGSSYNEMALSNQFNDFREHKSVKRNLNEYIPIAQVGELCIYRHKSNHRYYGTRKKSGVFRNIYTNSEKDQLAFVRAYPLLYDLYLRKKIDFSDYASEILFRRLY